MSSRVKREHYVPQTYLRNFSNRKKQVNVYDKGLERYFVSNIDSVAVEGKFFHFENPEGDEVISKMNKEQVIEKFFSDNIEGEYGQILKRLITNSVMFNDPESQTALTKTEKAELGILLAFQMLRTKDIRNTIADASEKFLKALNEKEEFNNEKMNNFIKEISQTDEKAIQAGMLFDKKMLESITDALLNHIWIFYINDTSEKFITSDNPIVRKGNSEDPNISGTGLKSNGVEIAFPISPNLLLVMYEAEFFKDLKHADENFIILKSNDIVKRYNALQIHGSYKQLYSRMELKPFISDIKEYHPELMEVRSKVSLYYNGKKY